jgi:phosphatidylglycerol---prolipoprotein diacylglyceryl transferase
MIAYIVWDISPEIIDGIVFFRWYGICWVVGMALGYKIMLEIYKVEKTPLIEIDKLTTYLVVGVIVGARLGHILFYDPVYYWHNPIEILPFRINPSFEFTGLAGLASHGGVIGALLALYLYNRKFQKGYLWLLDRITIGAAAMGAFIRLGNLLNSEIIGTPTDVPWAFVFVRVDEIPRHPAQLYEALFYFIISVGLYLLWKSKKFKDRHGFIFGLGVALMFTQRFLIEFVKENQVSFENTMALNMGQMLSIPLVLSGLALIIWSMSKSAAPNG